MKTKISIQGTDFYLNDEPTYKGRFHQGRRIEGLLLNARMVLGISDELPQGAGLESIERVKLIADLCKKRVPAQTCPQDNDFYHEATVDMWQKKDIST